MLFGLLLTLGVAVLSVGLRTFHNSYAQKAGALGILAATFLAVFFATDDWLWGLVAALGWLFLPWLEILTRIRALRLPKEKQLRPKSPPSSDTFPALSEITREIEDEGFIYVSDAGWDWEDYRQFFRLFYRQEDRAQAAICLNEQRDFSFYYLRISSRTKHGTVWTTWNYPLSYGLKVSPAFRTNRQRPDRSFWQLDQSHREFLRRNKVDPAEIEPLDEEQIQTDIEKDLRDQIAHNIHKGVLKQTATGDVKYSWRGMIYLWCQFLVDLVRLQLVPGHPERSEAPHDRRFARATLEILASAVYERFLAALGMTVDAGRFIARAVSGWANSICSFELAEGGTLRQHVHMLTDRQRSVLDFIQREQREKGLTPSTREIQNHFGFASQTSVMQYIAALERKGFLNRHARKARALITPAMKVRITDIPIYGQIPAGMSALTEQSIEGHVSVDTRSANVLKNRGTFALRVRGDSMIGAHIVDGDIVILEDTKEVHDGDIVAALIDGETSLKRYVMERGRPYLKAENPRYPDLVPARELKIQGVMVSLIRKQERRKRH